jgi:hypothetical protein
MKLLTLQENFAQLKSFDLVELECSSCLKPFTKTKRVYLRAIRGVYGNSSSYCSQACAAKQRIVRISLSCLKCNKVISKTKTQIRKNNFCSKSCAANWNNTHKATGTRVSKLEIWLQSKLLELYPFLEFHFNRKDAINSELDIYIPSLKLAFELNGIFHYEPIFGAEKLAATQNNDERKFQACLERGIELCIIDTNSMKKFTEEKAKKFLFIVSLVIEKLSQTK